MAGTKLGVYSAMKHGEQAMSDALAAAIAWREAAVADGWVIRPTYGQESVERAASLSHPDGFAAMVLARDNRGHDRPQQCYVPSVTAEVNVWGPDGLAVETGDAYDMDAIRAGLRICKTCGASDVDTQRYSFAGRCCASCRPKMAEKHEYAGWDR